MNQEQISEVKQQLWEYLEYLNVRAKEWAHQIAYSNNGLREAYRMCVREIEFWKTVEPSE